MPGLLPSSPGLLPGRKGLFPSRGCDKSGGSTDFKCLCTPFFWPSTITIELNGFSLPCNTYGQEELEVSPNLMGSQIVFRAECADPPLPLCRECWYRAVVVITTAGKTVKLRTGPYKGGTLTSIYDPPDTVDLLPFSFDKQLFVGFLTYGSCAAKYIRSEVQNNPRGELDPAVYGALCHVPGRTIYDPPRLLPLAVGGIDSTKLWTDYTVPYTSLPWSNVFLPDATPQSLVGCTFEFVPFGTVSYAEKCKGVSPNNYTQHGYASLCYGDITATIVAVN